MLTTVCWRFRKANIIKGWSHDLTVNDLIKDQLQYVVVKSSCQGLSRATRTFKVWCSSMKERAEYDIYELNLADKLVVYPGLDVQDHQMLTGQYTCESQWICDTSLRPCRTLRYRLILRGIGRNLTSFDDFREVLAGMRDAEERSRDQILSLTVATAHRESYYKANILHRGISPGNILIYDGGGLLIDWDISECGTLDIPRTSTWAFQSLRLSQRPEKNQSQVVHNRLDDLESFYHVLIWVSLQHARHEFNSAELSDYLTRLFNHVLIIDNKAYSNSSKLMHMTSITMLEKAKFQNPPLLELLLQISVNFSPLYNSPPVSNPILTKSQAKKAHRAGESYQIALENYKEDLNFLNSEEDSNWMEVCFEEALQYPDDKWGPTGYILNGKAPPYGG